MNANNRSLLLALILILVWVAMICGCSSSGSSGMGRGATDDDTIPYIDDDNGDDEGDDDSGSDDDTFSDDDTLPDDDSLADDDLIDDDTTDDDDTILDDDLADDDNDDDVADDDNDDDVADDDVADDDVADDDVADDDISDDDNDDDVTDDDLADDDNDDDITDDDNDDDAIDDDAADDDTSAQIPASIVLYLSSTQTTAGTPVVANWTVYDIYGDPIIGYPVFLSVDPGDGVTIQGHVITATIARDYTVRATVQGHPFMFDVKTLTVLPGPPNAIDLKLSSAIANIDQPVGYEVDITDQYGNKCDVEPTITIQPSSGWTLGDTSITFHVANTYNVTAMAAGLFDTEQVEVRNTKPPKIEWITPRGTWISSTGVALEGMVTEEGGVVTSFTINGLEVPRAPDGYFYYMFQVQHGLNIFKATAVDNSGNTTHGNISVLRGQKLTDNSWVEDSIDAYLTFYAFASIGSAAETIFNALPLKAILMALNPIYDDGFTIPGIGNVHITADIADVTYGAISLDLLPTIGGISVDFRMPNLSLTMALVVTINGNPTLYVATLSFTSIEFTAYASIDIVSNELTVTLQNVNLQMNGLSLIVPGLDPDILAMLSVALEGIMYDIVNNMLMEQLPPLFEGLFDDLEIAFTFSVFGVTLNVEGQFNDINFDSNGAHIILDAKTTSDTEDPNTPNFGGSLFSPGTPSTFGPLTPTHHNQYMFGLQLADDMLNQMLYRFYRAGLLTNEIDTGLTTNQLALFLPGLAELAPNAPVALRLAALLPPVLIFNTTKSAEFELQLGDFVIYIVAKPEGEDPIIAVSTALAIEAPLIVGINPNNNHLVLVLGDATFDVDVFDEVIDFPSNLIEELLGMFVPAILNYISNFLVQIPIPTIGGMTLDVLEMDVQGTLDDYFSIYANLSL